MNYWTTPRSALLFAIAACLALCLALAAAARAEPTTATAPTTPDLSTPKKAALAFAKAVAAGDPDGIKATSTGGDNDYTIIKAVSDLFVSIRQLQNATTKKFGAEAGKKIPDPASALVDQLERSEEKVAGDTATLILPEGRDNKFPPTLKKSGDEWKIDLKVMSADPDFVKMKDMAPKAVAAINGITQAVDAGKYPTLDDALTAFSETMAKIGTEK